MYFDIQNTIELAKELGITAPHLYKFGCDTCQEVCPWNRFSKSHSEPLFNPNPELLSFSKKDWIEITEETFSDSF